MKQIPLSLAVLLCVTLVLSCGEQKPSTVAIQWDETCEEFAEGFLEKLGPDYNRKDILSHARYCFKTMAPLFGEEELSVEERQVLAALCLMSGIEFRQSQLEYSGLLSEKEKFSLNQSCINDIAAMGAAAERVCLVLIRAIAPLNEYRYREKFPYMYSGYYAIFVLQRMRSRAALPALIEIADGELPLRGPAGRALGFIGDPSAIPVLRKLQRDRDELIRSEAGNAIRRIEQMPAETPLKHDVPTSPAQP